MSAISIHGRDLGTATGSAGPVNFSPINLGLAAGAGASSSSGTLGGAALPIGLLIVAAILLLWLG